MVDFLKRKLVFLVALALGWGGYAFLGEEVGKPKEASAKASMETIPESYLAMHDAGAARPRLVDPYRFERVTPPPGPAPALAAAETVSPTAGDAPQGDGAVPSSAPAVLADHAAPRSGGDQRARAVCARARLRALETALRDDIERGLERPARTLKEFAAAEQARRARFSLVLESTLVADGVGQARISGRTVLVGEAMPFLDPGEPPVLESVAGGVAVVVHRRQRHVLDLETRRRIDVGGPPQPAPTAAASAPKAAGPLSAASAASAASAGPAAAPPSAPAKTNGGYRVRGSNKKKP
jgi:hypothetical protein